MNAIDYIPDFIDRNNSEGLIELIEDTEKILDDLFGDHRFRLAPFLPPVRLWLYNFHLFAHIINFEGALRRLQYIKGITVRGVDDVISIPTTSFQVNQTTRVDALIIDCVRWITEAKNGLRRIQEKVN